MNEMMIYGLIYDLWIDWLIYDKCWLSNLLTDWLIYWLLIDELMDRLINWRID